MPVFASDSAELQERAVTLAIKHASRMGDEGHATIRDALDVLPYDLRLRAFAVFGGKEPAEPDPLDEFVPPALPRPDPPQRMPDPIVSVAEIMPMMNGSGDWMAWERMLAGFVALVHRDREGTAAALKPRLAGSRRVPVPGQRVSERLPGRTRMTGTGSSTGCSGPCFPHRHRAGACAWKHRLPDARRLSPPYLLLLHRAAEIQMAVEDDVVPPLLLSTPTFTTGHLDAAELVARLEIIEAAGQAARRGPAAGPLRLPRERTRKRPNARGASPRRPVAGRPMAGRDPPHGPCDRNTLVLQLRRKVEHWSDDGEPDEPRSVSSSSRRAPPVPGSRSST